MIGRTLLFAGGMIAMALAIVPQGGIDDDGPAPEPAGQADRVVASLDTTPDRGWYEDAHTLRRERDGHFYADVSLSGASTRMMVDTGASVIALTAADASAAGVAWNPSDVAPIGHGASGVVEGVNVVLPEVEVGGMVRRDVSAVVIPEGLGISLLGQSFLSRIDSVNIADDRMVLNAQ